MNKSKWFRWQALVVATAVGVSVLGLGLFSRWAEGRGRPSAPPAAPAAAQGAASQRQQAPPAPPIPLQAGGGLVSVRRSDQPVGELLVAALRSAHLNLAVEVPTDCVLAVDHANRPALQVVEDALQRADLAVEQRRDGLYIVPQRVAGRHPDGSQPVAFPQAVARMRANDFQRGVALFRPRDLTELDAIVRDLRVATSSEIRVAATNPALGVVRLSFPEAYPVMQVVAALRRDKRVENPEPNYRAYQLGITPNDPDLVLQWHLTTIRCPEAWEVTQGSPEVVIAIVDTGIDYNHPDLAGDGSHVIKGWDFVNNDADPMDDEGHGTHCAGIAAGLGNNGVGICGVAFHCRLLAVKVIDADGSGYNDDIAQGIQYAADHGASIISLSLGGTVESGTMTAAVDYAFGRGCLVVAAAGNDGIAFPSWPAACRNAMAIAATDSNDQRADFSTYGQTLDLAAPGVNIFSTIWNDSYTNASGTSMATPCVAGVAGLIKSAFPGMSAAQLREKLWHSTNATTWTDQLGYGRIDAALAVGVSTDFAVAKIAAPDTDTWTGRLVKLRGTAASADLAGFVVEWSTDGSQWNATGVTLAHGGTQSVEEDWLATWDATGQATGDYTLRLTVTSRGGKVATNSIRVHLDTRILPGWPQWTRSGNPSYGWNAPVITDIDGDGRNEVIATDQFAVCHIWDGEGNLKPGWPQFGISTTPTVADFDGDGKKEIVGHFQWCSAATSDPELFGYRYDGTPLPGFPKDFGWPIPPMVTDDIDLDGQLEMVFCPGGNNYHALRIDGTEPAGWPVYFDGDQHGSMAVVADVDGDGDKEIAFGNNYNGMTGGCRLYIFHHDGTLMRWIELSDGMHLWWPPVVGDVNGDGQPELVVAYNRGIRVFTSAGTELPQFALVGTQYNSAFGMALADLDGDGFPNLVAAVDLPDRVCLVATDRNGQALPGWPVDLVGAGLTVVYTGACPVIGDVDGDRQLEIVLSLNLGGMGVFSRTGQVLQRFQFRIYPAEWNYGTSQTVALGDVDGNGSTDLVVAQSRPTADWSSRGAVFALSLGGPPQAGELPWPGLGTQHGLANRWYRTATDNIRPSAKPLTVRTPVNQPLAITLIGHDEEGAPLTYGVVTPPAHGTLTGAAPNVTYTPAANYRGLDAFTYKVNDGQRDSTVATVNIVVDDAPVAQDQSVFTSEDTAVPVPLSAADANGDPLTYGIVTAPVHGTLTGAAPNLAYVPALDYNGTDAFTYRANDGLADSNVATVSLTIAAVNDPPVPGTDLVTTTIDTPVLVPDVLANDVDVDGDPVTLVAFTQPTHGTAALQAGNAFLYTPAAGYYGLDPFTYTVRDDQGASAIGQVQVVVQEPEATAGAWPTMGNGPQRTAFAAIALDAAAPAVGWTASLGAGKLHQVAVGQSRVFVTPADSWLTPAWLVALDSGTGTELWRQSFGATHNLGPPTFADGRVYVQRRGRGGEKPDAQLLVFDAGTGQTVWRAPYASQWYRYYAPAVADGGVFMPGGRYGGICGLNAADGSLRFFNELDGSGCDGWAPSYSAGKVYAWVADRFRAFDPVNGASLWSLTLNYFWTDYGQRSVVAVADGGAYLTSSPNLLYAVELARQAVRWQLTGTFTGSPAVFGGSVYALSGSSVKAYAVADGTLQQTYAADTALIWQPIVTPNTLIVASSTKTYVFDLASAVLRQTIPDGGRISLAGTRLYVATESGTIRTYRFSPSNHPPAISAAGADPNPVTWPGGTLVSVSANDADGDPLTYAWCQVSGPGTATFAAPAAATGGVTLDVAGSYLLRVTVSDGQGGEASSYVSVTVTTGGNHPPVIDTPAWAEPNPVTLPAGTTVQVLAHDPDGDPLSYGWTMVSGPAVPTFATPATADSGVTFAAAGTYVLRVSVSDGQGNRVSSNVTISVTTQPNRAPVAQDQTVSTAEDTAKPITLVATDADHDALLYSMTQPAHGALSGTPPHVTYTPAADYCGADSFTFRASDGKSLSNVATVALTVTPVQDNPTLTAAGSPPSGTAPLTVNFTATGRDADGDPLTYAWTFGDGGTAAVQNPRHTYAAAGTYTAVVTVADGQGGTATSTVNVTVTAGGNQPPVIDSPAWADPNPVTLPAGTTVHVAAHDPDGDPLTYAWTMIAGPVAPTFAMPAASGSDVAFRAAGDYTLRVNVSDGQGGSATSDVRVRAISSGIIVAWGANDYGQGTVPSPNRDFIGIGAGYSHSLGLKSDGSLAAWGRNDYGQCNVPSPNGDFAASAAGRFHSLGLKSDGRIVAWGSNTAGQCTVPSPNSGFIAIAAGGYHSLGLKSDGSIVAWGGNSQGQCSVQNPNTRFTAIAAGQGHSLGLKSDGSIVAWGSNEYGQCTVPSPNGGFIGVAAGYYHSLGLKSDGSIVAWGANWLGQCTVPSPNSGFTAIAAGYLHSLGLKSDGRIAGWGDNFYGQRTVPSPNIGFTTIAAGNYHSLGVRPEIVNQPPVIDTPAWADPNPVVLPAETTVHVVASDPDGDPLSYAWEMVSGPAAPTFATPAATDSGVTFHDDGSYTLRVTVSDGRGGTGTSEVEVRAIWAGSIITWGKNDYGQCTVPSPNRDFIGMAAGLDHSLGLKRDGSLAAWGRNDYNQCTVPSPNSDFAAIAAGWYHNLGLKNNGSIVAWGKNDIGQCTVPSPNIGFLGIAAGDYHSLGLKSDGSIVAWPPGSSQCTVPSPNSNFSAVAAGAHHSLGLKNDGSIVAWGDNVKGQCNVPSPNSGFVAIAAGYGHSLGLKSDGSIVGWGDNWRGQCAVPSPNSDFTAIATCDDHSLGLKNDGRIVAWGTNYDGESNVPSPNGWFSAVAAGGSHSLGLRPASANQPPVIDSPAWADDNPLTMPTAGTTVHVVAHDPNGDALTYGWELVAGPAAPTFATPAAADSGVTFPAIGDYTLRVTVSDDFDGTATSEVSVTVVAGANQPPVIDTPAWAQETTVWLPAGTTVHVVAHDPDGDPLIFGWNLGSGPAAPTFATPATADSGVTFPSAGSYVLRVTVRDGRGGLVTSDVTVFLISPGSIVAWGRDTAGQCVVPSPNSGFTAIAGGGYHSLGLKNDGTVVGWGANSSGQCTVPSPNSGFVAVAAGYSHSLGLRNDGSLVAWGSNTYSQCTVPSPNSGFVAVAAGNYHCLGLKDDGSVVAWGRNEYGQCTVPSPNTGFIAAAAGASHSLALKSDGTIVAWGSNGNGQCNVPTPNSGFIAVASGTYHGLGLKSGGSVVSWGSNSQNKLPSPNSGFTAIAAGAGFSLGLKNDGTVVGWGDNTYGQCTVPSPNCCFTAIAAGHYHSLGLWPATANQPPTIDSPAWAVPNPVTLPAGTTVRVVASDPDGDTLTYGWSMVSGPAAPSFAAPAAATGGVTFSAAGTYVLRVTVTDGRGGTATSDVTVTVNAGVDARADVNHDGVVNALDLQIVIANFGQSVGAPGCDPRADANADGVVNALDLQIVIANFGTSIP